MSQGSTKGVPIDTDSTMASNSDALVPSQKAVKTAINTLPKSKGTLVSDHYQRASLGANYTKQGSGTNIITGNELVISGGSGSGSFSDRLDYTGYGRTNVNQFTQNMFYKVGSKDATIGFLGIGVQYDFGFNGVSFFAGMFQTTNASFDGLIKIYRVDITTVTTVASSASNISYSIGDIISFEFSREQYVLTMKVFNVTTNSSTVVVTFTYPLIVPTANQLNSTGYFSILTYAGTQNVLSWVIKTKEKQNPNYCFLGDSITEAFSVSNYNNNYTELVASKTGVVVVKFARANAVTQDILNTINETISFKPVKVFIMVGGNDIYYGVAAATWQANLTSIWNALISANIPFTNLLATPRSNGTGVLNVVPLNNYIIASGYAYIDTYTPLASGITANPKYYNSDLIHPNDLGHEFISSIILNQL